MKRPEQAIHKAVVQHLNMRAEPRVYFFHPANGGKRSVVEGAIFKSLGVQAGTPDLIILKAGEMYCLELKAPSGRLSPSQRVAFERLEHCGAKVATASSLDEALITLEVWGILKRSVNPPRSEASQESQEG